MGVTINQRKKLIAELNPQQKEAVRKTLDVPSLVIAGAGSGKTKVLTTRIAYILSKYDDPGSILAVTFTNKAAGEMRDRVASVVGDVDAKSITIGTFHSLCVRWLHKYYSEAGLRKGWTILDDDDTTKIIKSILKDMNLPTEKEAVRMYKGTISTLKNDMIGPADYRNKIQYAHERTILKVYQEYMDRLTKQNVVDFDDLLFRMVRVLENFPKVRRRFQRRFEWVMVDEYQDTNECQYRLVKLIVGKHNNLFIVGDDYQCWQEDTIIQTLDGPMRAGDLEIGHRVQTSENGKLTYAVATGVNRIDSAPMVRITTKSGKKIEVTPNHKVYATMPAFDKDVYYLYLMYRKDKGYRIGVLTGGIAGTIGSRAHSERPERMWLLGRFENKNKAYYAESRLSLKYGVPTHPFMHNGRGLGMTQDSLDKIFASFGSNGETLLDDLGFLFDYPHHVPQGTTKFDTQHRVVNIMTNVKGVNQISLEYDQFRTRKWVSSYRDAYHMALKLQEDHDATFIRERFSMGKGIALQLFTANSLLPTMQIPVDRNGVLELEDIVSVEDAGTGVVIDIEVERTGTVVGNGVLTHNSIYGWRGANIQKILNFQNDYPSAQVLKLEQNYRSTQTIVEAGNKIMENAPNQMSKTCFSQNPVGDPISVHQARYDKDEAAFVAEEIMNLVTFEGYKYSEIAILYRTNILSRLFEERFMTMAIPYNMVSGFSFYDRREIKETLGWLQMCVNPDNDIACERILTTMPGLGKTTIENLIREQKQSGGLSLYQVVERFKPKLIKTRAALATLIATVDKMSNLYALGAHLSDQPISDMLEIVLETTSIAERYKESSKAEDQDRADNIFELASMAKGYEQETKKPNLQDFLDQIALASQADKVSKKATDKVQMMTLHTSKGLEYRAVFFVGFENGLMPHANAKTPDTLAEERRLAYVGITRAKERLYLSSARARMNWSRQWENKQPSDFLDLIPQSLRQDV